MRFAPRKRFGQHFLVDEAVVTAIIEAINPQQNETLIEIGPGLGALTRPLLTRSGGLTVVELDRDLAARLSRWPKLNVVQADALKLDFATMAIKLGGKLRVIGNLPYNVSTPILFHLMEYSEHVLDQHVMLQKEVVTRMIAQPGNKDYGRLSVMLQWRYLMEAMFDVPPGAFDPPPRVNSTVVRMSPRAVATEIDPKLLSVLVRTAFSQRRKRLSNTLGRWLSTQGYCGSFDLRRRAEEVPVNEYLELAQDTAKILSQKHEGVPQPARLPS